MHIKRAACRKFSLLPGTFAFFLAFPLLCPAVLVNRTIDSQYGDPVTGFVPLYHSPRPAWNDQTCVGCWVKPDPARAFNGTWMAATYHPDYQNINFTLQFTGVAIWVFFILSNVNVGKHGTSVFIPTTQCNFTLDGQLVGNFSYDPDLSTYDMIYNATVFSQTGLMNTPHHLLVSVNDYPHVTFVNFDWAMYTVDVDPSTIANATSSSNTISSPTVASSTAANTTSSSNTISSPTVASSTAANTTSSSNTISSPTTAFTSASPNTTTLSSNSSSKIGIIVGCLLGVLALVPIVIVFFIFRRRSARLRRQNLETSDIDTPYVVPTSRPSTSQPPPFDTLPSSGRDQDPGGDNPSAMPEAELNERIMAAQRELNRLTSLQALTSESRETRHQVEELTNQIELEDQPPAYS